MIKKKTIEIAGGKVYLRTPPAWAYIDMQAAKPGIFAILGEPTEENSNVYMVGSVVGSRIGHLLQIVCSVERVNGKCGLKIPKIQDGTEALIAFYHAMENPEVLNFWEAKELIGAAEEVCKPPGDPETQPENPS
jgi:hypothetical protein